MKSILTFFLFFACAPVHATSVIVPYRQAPTIQRFTSTGTQTGWLFNVTGWSGTIAVGDTYTNNANTFTALAAQTNGTGQTLWMSCGTCTLSGTTLTKAVSAAGPATMTFTNSGTNVLNPQTLATYTRPNRYVPFLRVKIAGAGGGGGAEGGSAVAGGDGNVSAFGPLLGICTGGVKGAALTSATMQLGGAGGTCTVTSPAVAIVNVAGGQGSGNGNSNGIGPTGGVGFFGGMGAGGPAPIGSGSPAGAGAANTGAGGGGGGSNVGSTQSGPGGGAGGFAEIQIPNPGLTYYYTTGAGGAASTNAGANAGGAGGSGVNIVEEW